MTVDNLLRTHIARNMSGPTISLGLGARGLKDKDFMSVSDPYVTVSRPDARGGFTLLRTSETKKVISGRYKIGPQLLSEEFDCPVNPIFI